MRITPHRPRRSPRKRAPGREQGVDAEHIAVRNGQVAEIRIFFGGAV
jgi:hypothetical protein